MFSVIILSVYELSMTNGIIGFSGKHCYFVDKDVKVDVS